MHTPGLRHSTPWLALAASLAVAGCAPLPSTLALEPTLLPTNVRLTRPAPRVAIADAPVSRAGEISLAESALLAGMIRGPDGVHTAARPTTPPDRSSRHLS